MMCMRLETERLFLDTWQRSDWTELRPIAIDVEVVRYINGGVPWSDQEIQSFVDRQVNLIPSEVSVDGNSSKSRPEI
jgi:hypothetical protein